MGKDQLFGRRKKRLIDKGIPQNAWRPKKREKMICKERKFNRAKVTAQSARDRVRRERKQPTKAGKKGDTDL